MRHRASLRFVLIAFSVMGLLWQSAAAAPAGMRHAGSVLTVDASTGTLNLEEYWINGQRRVLKVRITPDTQVVRSERKEMFSELTETFTTTPIHPRDLKTGDFVVVELVETAPDSIASLVMVTYRATAGS